MSCNLDPTLGAGFFFSVWNFEFFEAQFWETLGLVIVQCDCRNSTPETQWDSHLTLFNHTLCLMQNLGHAVLAPLHYTK